MYVTIYVFRVGRECAGEWGGNAGVYVGMGMDLVQCGLRWSREVVVTVREDVYLRERSEDRTFLLLLLFFGT